MYSETPNVTLTEKQIQDLSAVYIAFLIPSVIGSFSVLVVCIVRWNHLIQQVHLLAPLALADLLAALSLMSTSVMNLVGYYHRTACQCFLSLSLTFYFISFLMVVIYAWKSMNGIRGWRAREGAVDASGPSQYRWKTAVLYASVWLIPIALYLILIFKSLKHSASRTGYNDNRCILFLHLNHMDVNDIAIMTLLLVAVLAVLVSCIVIYIKVGKWYEKYQDQCLFGDGRNMFRRLISTARYMVVVILCCWTPAFVLIAVSLVLYDGTTQMEQCLFFLFCIQAVGVSLHGLLNSIVYAWRRRNFTEAVLGENTPLMLYSRRAFFDESLRNPS